MAARPTPRSDRLLLVAAMAVSSANLVVYPLLPALQERLGLSTSALGLLSGIGFLASVIGQLGLAPRSDRWAPATLLTIGTVGMAVSMFVTAAASSYAVLLAGRVLAGIAFGVFFPVARGVVVRDREVAGYGRALSRLSAAEFAGLVVGPFGGSLIASAADAPTALVVGGVATALVALPLARAGHRWPPGAPGGEAAPGAAPAPARPRLDLLRQPGMASAVLMVVGVMVMVGVYDTIWARYLTDIGASQSMIGLSFALFAVPYMAATAPAGWFIDRLGPSMAASWGFIGLVASLVTYGVIRDPWAATAVSFAEAGAQAVTGPAGQAAVAAAAPPGRSAEAQGTSAAIGTVAAGAVSVAAAPVYDAFGQVAVFVGSGGLVAVIVVVASALHRGARRAPASSPAR